MTIHAAKSMVKPGATIEFKPQWLTTNATYDKKITIIRGTEEKMRHRNKKTTDGNKPYQLALDIKI